MIIVRSFEDEVAYLKKVYEWDYYEYSNRSEKFRACTTKHFRVVKEKERYGVYIVRQRDTREVLYIGKGGTVDSQGQFKGQDVPGRLKNVKGSNVKADKWFLDLLQKKGPLIIEYIFLPISRSPAFVETILLQEYLNEHHHLPYKNKTL